MFCKIPSNILKQSFQSIYFLRLYQTHYEVLQLPRDCTNKQIKNAFIKLSKEHHPDVNKNKISHAKFLQISEAYEVLGKAESRRNYDLGLSSNLNENINPYRYNSDTFYKQKGYNPYHDPLFWTNRDKSKDQFYGNRPYYGIKGLKKLSNGTIAIFCVILAVMGVALQFMAITKSVTFKRDELIRRSMEAEKLLKEARDMASVNGNQAQIEALKVKLLSKTN